MATVTRAEPTGEGVADGIEPYRLTVSQFAKIVDAGVFPDDARVELLEGMLVDKMIQHNPHVFAVDMLGDLLGAAIPAGWFVREEKPVQLSQSSQPEPDLAVIRGSRPQYRKGFPVRADLSLLVEVADTSYAKDLGLKWRLYAGARIPVYWIVNLNERRVEVYSRPAGRGNTARYDLCDTYGEDATVPVVIDGAEVGRVAVADLLI